MRAVTFAQVNIPLTLTPEAESEARRIHRIMDDPQDLNEALLSVRIDEWLDAVQASILDDVCRQSMCWLKAKP